MAFLSRDSAEELAQKINAARAEDINDNADFELAIVLVENGEEKDAGIHRVKEVRPAKRLLNERELVYCTTLAADRKIEILFPPIGERVIGVAEIIISDD